MEESEYRWLQRLQNFSKAWTLLKEAIELSHLRELSELEDQGLIQRFEFSHELAWNVLKDYFEYQGTTTITGSRDAIREAFQVGIITDGEGWMDMIKSRNQSTHTYNEEIANEVKHRIIYQYYALFDDFDKKMKQHIP